MTGLAVAFALGACAGVGLAVLLLFAVVMAGGDDPDDRGGYRPGGNWTVGDVEAAIGTAEIWGVPQEALAALRWGLRLLRERPR